MKRILLVLALPMSLAVAHTAGSSASEAVVATECAVDCVECALDCPECPPECCMDACPGKAIVDDVVNRVTDWAETHFALSRSGSTPVCSCEPKCSTLAERCHNAFARALVITNGATIEFLGESCCDLQGGLVSLAARSEGETICLFVLLREAAPIIHEKIRRGLSIHRRDLGDLSAFEVEGSAVWPALALVTFDA